MRERTRYVRGMFSWVGFRQIGVPYTRPSASPASRSTRTASRSGSRVDGIVSFSNAPLRARARRAASLFSTLAFVIGGLRGRREARRGLRRARLGVDPRRRLVPRRGPADADGHARPLRRPDLRGGQGAADRTSSARPSASATLRRPRRRASSSSCVASRERLAVAAGGAASGTDPRPVRCAAASSTCDEGELRCGGGPRARRCSPVPRLPLHADAAPPLRLRRLGRGLGEHWLVIALAVARCSARDGRAPDTASLRALRASRSRCLGSVLFATSTLVFTWYPP